MKNEMLMIWFGWPKVVTGDCLHFRVPFYEVYQCLISETDVESFALEGRDSVAEVSFQYEIDCSARVLENVIMKNYVACFYVVAFYSRPHSCSLCTHSGCIRNCAVSCAKQTHSLSDRLDDFQYLFVAGDDVVGRAV
jgi:hypothetical protein